MTRRTPAFIVADADREARERMLAACPPAWFYLPVDTGEEALRYYRRFRDAAAGIFLAEGVTWCGGDDERGLEHVVRTLLDEENDARIVVLLELPDAASVARWKERGAFAVLPHPTHRERRQQKVRDALDSLAHAFWAIDGSN